MTMRKESRSLVGIFLLFFILYFVISALGYGPKSRLFPLTIGIPTALLAALSLISIWRPNVLTWANVRFGGSSSPEDLPAPDGQEETPSAKSFLRMTAWLFFSALAIGLVGFRIAVPLYILLFSRFEGGAKWTASILVAAVTLAFILGYFDLFMQFSMFKGVLFGDQLPLF